MSDKLYTEKLNRYFHDMLVYKSAENSKLFSGCHNKCQKH